MAADDLSKPLGQDKTGQDKNAPKGGTGLAIGAVLPKLVAGILGFCLAIFVLWIIVVDDPLGGEPKAIVALPSVSKPVDAGNPNTPSVNASADALSPTREKADETKPEAGKTVTIIDGSSGKREEVVVSGAAGGKPADNLRAGALRAGDPRLLETTRHGLVPKVGADGARASEVYARPVPAQTVNQPRIAIVITGLGISAAGTNDALSKLPAAVTLAFAPYGSDLERLAARARSEGHEILLQIPMEPYDYPDSDPGPQTLLTSLSAEQNIDRLYWQMSRFQAYVGIANYMGARFTATDAAFAPVLREVAKRGLLYLEDGVSPRSLASQLAGANAMPFAKGDVVLDAVPSGVEIGRALSKLEILARENGVAIGIGGALPLTIERVAQWAKAAAGRGFLLVPISAAAVKAKSS